ncbi:hypothetical protein ABT288_08065 [Streptomyces sp. NPDC001093]|uniref:hypothetical protein n=1 Tax=Streptomyces sp. NPDC001093 TaxID=3154376 RepID=UPI00332779D9
MSPTPSRSWSQEDISDLFELDEEHERHAMETVVACIGELADRGVDVEDVERDIDAESGRMVAAGLRVEGTRELRAHFPSVPLPWLRSRADFAEERRVWAEEEIIEMFVQGEGYVDWAEAVEAGVRVARTHA